MYDLVFFLSLYVVMWKFIKNDVFIELGKIYGTVDYVSDGHAVVYIEKLKEKIKT